MWRALAPSNPNQVVQTNLAGRAAAPAALSTVDVEEGSLVVIVIPGGGEKPTIVDRTPEWMSFGVDDWYLVYNAVEALANPVVAMQE
jgi:hypothetical protein